MDNRRVARELIRISKMLEAFWNLEIVPPSMDDVKASLNICKGFLQGEGMSCDDLEFQRYMVYQENVVCTGPDCKRNSNKFLCVFGWSDKDGTFGGAVAGGRMGRKNKPRLYQKWGITGVGADGENKLKKLIDTYIRKKTSQRDAYQEVNMRIND